MADETSELITTVFRHAGLWWRLKALTYADKAHAIKGHYSHFHCQYLAACTHGGRQVVHCTVLAKCIWSFLRSCTSTGCTCKKSQSTLPHVASLPSGICAINVHVVLMIVLTAMPGRALQKIWSFTGFNGNARRRSKTWPSVLFVELSRLLWMANQQSADITALQYAVLVRIPSAVKATAFQTQGGLSY